MLNAFLARASVLRAPDIRRYKSCEHATEALVYLMVVFSPWAFGTTQSWSRCTMNAAGYALGLLLLLKLWIRWTKGYRPWRWDDVARSPSGNRTPALPGMALRFMIPRRVQNWRSRLPMNRPLSLPSPPLGAGERVAEGRERGRGDVRVRAGDDGQESGG